jgi:putative toxin-antitoxin system antitoxin component (TIGR02293 family)
MAASALRHPRGSGSRDLRGRGPAHLVVTDYPAVYKAEPFERIGLIKAGIRASDGKKILKDLELTTVGVNLPRSTVDKKAKSDQTLSQLASERLVGLAKLVGQVQTMVHESGDATGFNATAWTSRWLNTPLPALAGRKPLELMDTMEGQSLVADTLARIQSGAFA